MDKALAFHEKYVMTDLKTIEQSLRNLDDVSDLRAFFQALGYEYVDQSLPTRDFKPELKERIKEDSLRQIAQFRDFPIIFCQVVSGAKSFRERNRIKTERFLLRSLPAQYSDCLLVTLDNKTKLWHFVNSKPFGNKLRLRRFAVGPEEKLRTAVERLAQIQVTPDDDWAKVLQKHEDAFDREKVSDEFFKEYRRVFLFWKSELLKQTRDPHIAHNFLQQFLNRLMFIYFIQRKGWLGSNGSAEFIKRMWELYRKGSYPKNSFYNEWLRVLFFKVLNDWRYRPKKTLPEEINSIFGDAPYLNGGLFKETLGIDDQDIKVSDDLFEDVFNSLLDRYNFTVQEDTPFDQSVSVDPEMLGVVYEQLVNVTDFQDEQASSGIFYTPRIEVDFMCRRSLLEYLSKNAGVDREGLYDLLFADDHDAALTFGKEERKALSNAIRQVQIVDPACGSGAFLVGMMQVILDIERRLFEAEGKSLNEFDAKKRIIERSLYGVDVKDWAIGVAQLRLWLSLIVEADDKKLDLQGMKIAGEALLPSLSFKIREGDSLVQEIAGKPFPIRDHARELDESTKGKISELRRLKSDFFFNRGEITEHDLRRKERNVYASILDKDIKKLEAERKTLRLPVKKAVQEVMFKTSRGEQAELSVVAEEEKRVEKRLTEVESRLTELKAQRADLSKTDYLFWGIEFAEIFFGNGKQGFDIVIGNPPYVRQERIAEPRQDNPTKEQKKEYKTKLQQMAKLDWGDTMKIGGQADLYVYFYLRGLRLLNPDGVFCFITSNSWLDVAYGKELQEFLVTRVPISAIYDNQAKRSFKHADVNTIITVFGAPLRRNAALEYIARFVMFKKPFEEAITSRNLMQVEKANKVASNDDLRVFPISQQKLYEDGLQLDEADKKKRMKLSKDWSAPYIGNKWGGKYLRAPDIFWKIIERNSQKLRQLSAMADVRFGVKTGCNEFFYLPNEDADLEFADTNAIVMPRSNGFKPLNIPSELLKQTLFSLKEIESINRTKNDERKMLVSLPPVEKSKLPRDIKGYIDFGESKGYHRRPTCSNRNPWYSVAYNWKPAPFIFPSKIGERFLVFVNAQELLEDKKLYGITPRESDATMDQWAVVLNSSVLRLFMELMSRQLTGAQAIADVDVAVVKKLHIPNPALLNKAACQKAIKLYNQKIESCFSEFGLDKAIPIREQELAVINPRLVLDSLIFELLGLNPMEQRDVYYAIAEIVKARLDKAESV